MNAATLKDRTDWLFRMANNLDDSSLASRMRAERFRRFLALLEDYNHPARILDAGGSSSFWRKHWHRMPLGTSVVLLNTLHEDRTSFPGLTFVDGDVRHMDMFREREFDICYSNSLLEHVGTQADQQHAAEQIRRVSRGFFVQTPNLHFPIEPHFLTVGWQYAPVSLRTYLLRMRPWGWMKSADSLEEARAIVQSIRLLNEKQLRQMFPDGKIYREKLGPFTKSLVAWRAIS